MKSAEKLETDLQEMPAQVEEKVRAAGAECRSHCNSSCQRAKDLIVRNPVPTVLGALVFGAAVGYLIYSRREEETTISNRIARDVDTLRSRLSNAPGRISSLFHDGMDRAATGAEKASEYIHDLPTRDVLNSISNSLNRIGSRLKFW